MNFKGHDCGELIDAFGIKEMYLKDPNINVELNKNPWEPELDEAMIRSYIKEHTNFPNEGGATIDEDVRGHMVDFLYALSNNEWCNEGDKFMLRSVLALSYRSDDFAFYRWFIHCLPLMWT